MSRIRRLGIALGASLGMVLVPTAAQARLMYVPNYTCGYVSVINTTTNTASSLGLVAHGSTPGAAADSLVGRVVWRSKTTLSRILAR
jgi:hypothetical protein